LDEIKKVGIELPPPEKNKGAHYFISSGGTQLSCPQNKNTAGVIKYIKIGFVISKNRCKNQDIFVFILLSRSLNCIFESY